MSDLIRHITPPGVNTRLGNTSPRSYLTDTEILSPIRKRGLTGFKEHDMKRLRLDPSPISDDRTILEYPSKINIRMPFTSTLENLISNRQEDSQWISSLEQSALELQRSHSELQKSYAIVEIKLQPLLRSQLAMYQANLLARTIDIMYEKKGLQLPEGQEDDPTRSSRKYTEAANRIGREHFERDFGLPLKYHDVLKKYSELIKMRYIIAHETEVSFAKLLMWPEHFDSPMYHFWEPLFVFCYGKSIEELANKEENYDIYQSFYD